MAIDLNALRAKHQQLTNPNTGGGDQDFLNKFYQVKEGEAYLRILPAQQGSDKNFYAETKIHRVPQPDGSVRTITAVRFMERSVLSVISTTPCGRRVPRRTRTLLARSSPVLVTT